MKLNIYILENYQYLENLINDAIVNIDGEANIIFYSKENEFEELVKAAEFVQEDLSNNRAIIIDTYGTLPFMVTTKHSGIICAQLSDEHSALMTRDHNNSNIISVGAEIVGNSVIRSIVKRFVEHEYAAGRHQIRIDMLNEMGGS